MQMSDIRETAEFRIVGRVFDTPILKVSAKGTNYIKPTVQVKAGPKAFPRKWFVVGFGDIADDFSLNAKVGDTVEVKGELQIQKNTTTDRWETSYIMREFKTLAEAPENNEESIAEAFGAADITDVEF
jgi:hypothetical protein